MPSKNFIPAQHRQVEPSGAQLSDVAAKQRVELSTKQLAELKALSKTILDGFSALRGFMASHTSTTTVTNQPSSISTPDVKQVVEAVAAATERLDKPTPDLTRLEESMAAAVAELQAIPKKHEKPSDSVKVSNLGSLEKVMKEVRAAIAAIDLKPTPVNVEAPSVTVEPVDLKPIEKAIKELHKAIASIERVPERVETEQVNAFISEKFDSYHVQYDDENSPEPIVEDIFYYLAGQQVAHVHYRYGSYGNLIEAKRV